MQLLGGTLFKLASQGRAPPSPLQRRPPRKKPILPGAGGELMDDRRLQGAAADAGVRSAPKGCRLLLEGRRWSADGWLLPGRTWHSVLPIFVRGHLPGRLQPQIPPPPLCSPGRSHTLAFLALALCPPMESSVYSPLASSHPQVTLPATTVTHFVPSPFSPHSSPLPGSSS